MPENSKTAGKNRLNLRQCLFIICALGAAGLYYFGLDIPLVGPDEPRYAQVAREMFERRDWITPTLGGYHWFEKPALLYWLQIASYNIFGISEFSARFGSALCGLGTIGCLWIIARVSGRSSEFANWIALIAASTIGLIVFSRGASFDIVLTFPLTAALAGYFVYQRSSTQRLRLAGLAGFYLFIGIALLAKGLVGIVFPLATVALYHLLSRRFPKRIATASVVWGIPLAMIVAAVWYLPMYQRHGYEFIDQFFVQHHFQRFSSNKYFHPQPFYFFLWVLPLTTFPWLPFFFAALWRWGRDAMNPKSNLAEIGDADLRLFAGAWVLVPLIFFSFSGSKLPGYILPALPGAVLIIADFVFRYVRGNTRREYVALGIVLTTFLTVVLTVIFAVPRFAEDDSVKHLIAAADERGFSDSVVLNLHTTSHNAEYYAAGRLVRIPDGRQKRYLGTAEVLAAIRERGGQSVLVLVPLEYLDQLVNAEGLAVDVIRKNSELAIASVRER